MAWNTAAGLPPVTGSVLPTGADALSLQLSGSPASLPGKLGLSARIEASLTVSEPLE